MSRTDRTPTKASTTSYSYPADGATSSRPHFVTGTTTTGDNPGSASYAADAAGNTVKRPAPGGGEQDLVWDVRINQGSPRSAYPSQQVDHVIVRSGGKVLGPDGVPITRSIKENPQAHIPLSDWVNWSSWNTP